MSKTGIILLVIVAFILTAGLNAQDKVEKIKESELTEFKVDKTSEDQASEKEQEKEQADKIIAYYFHGNRRCPSCMKIEAYTGQAIDSAFEKMLEDGSVEWAIINTDEKGNEHYMKDYKLYTKSVVISKVEDGKEIDWKNLDQVWTLLGKEKEFKKYIVTEIESFMEKD